MNTGRIGAFVGALVPALWIGLLLIYAARGRMTSEAVKTAALGGFFSAPFALIGFALAHIVGADASGAWGILKSSFVGAAIPEETARLVLLAAFVYRHEDVSRPFSRRLAGGWAGLGFAALENLFYVVGKDGWQHVALVRAATAMPSHVVTGLIMGALLARAREAGGCKSGWIATALAVSIIVHGTYDTFALSIGAPSTASPIMEQRQAYVGLALILVGEVAVAHLLVAWTLRAQPARPIARASFEPPWMETNWRRRGMRLFPVMTAVVAIGSIALAGLAAAGGSSFSAGPLGSGIAWIGFAALVQRVHRRAALEDPRI